MRNHWFIGMVILCTSAYAQPKSTNGRTTAGYTPSLAAGERLYIDNCSVCHGTKGLSNTGATYNLKKKPAAIGDPKVLNRLSPQKVYDVITKGFVNSGMPSYSHLDIKQRWDLAAYIFTLNCNFEKPNPDIRASIAWEETKVQTDSEIVEILRKRGVPEDHLIDELSAIRYLLE